MHINVNCNQPKAQSFGAIHSSDTVNKIIKSRIKTYAEFEKLDQIVEKAKDNNLVDINLLPCMDDTICANIFAKDDVSSFFTRRSENFFTKTFGGGIVGFIEKCSNIADKAAIKVQKAKDIADSEVFNKLK